jgi:hypothetical protein
MDRNGISVIAWTHSNNNGTTSVMMERFGTSGAPLGSPITIKSAAPAGSTHQPSAAMDNAGDIVLAYTDSTPVGTNLNGGLDQVKGILFASGGGSTQLTVTSLTPTSQPSVAMGETGNFVVAFADAASAANQDIYAQRFSSTGTAQGAAIPVATTSHIENEPSAAIDTQGDFVVAYTYVRSSQLVPNPPFPSYVNNQTEVHAVLFDAQGNVQTTETVWASPKDTESGYVPCAAMDASGNFIVAYTKGGNDGAFDPNDGAASVWAVAYDNKGAVQQAGINLSAPMPPPKQANDDTGAPIFYQDSRPSVALSVAGHLVADWQNYGTTYQGDLMSTAVYTQTFVKAPFQYVLQDGTTIDIQGGMPATYHIAINRDSGFTGPISVSFSQLPTGVTASVSPDNPVPSEILTVTFQSDDSVPNVYLPSILQISGGSVTLSPTVYFSVMPSFINGWTTTDPDGTTLVDGFATTIAGAGFVAGSTVQFGSASATATPTSIDPSGKSLTVTVPMNAVSGPITILRPGGEAIVSTTNAQYTEGGINSLNTTVGYAPGYSKFYLQAGSSVTIAGYGLQQKAVVLFGPGTSDPQKLKDLASKYGTAPTSVDPSGTSLSVNVPLSAVTGPLVVVEPDGTALQSAQTFTVNDYRNTNGFSFGNFNPNVNFDNLKAEYGGSQVDIAVNVFGNEIDTGIPSPWALGVVAVAAGSLSNGACFGMALTSVLLSEYTPSLIDAANGLPANAAPTVFNLQQNGPLTDMINHNHLAQISVEVINYYVQWQASSHSAASVYNQISTMLAAGQNPLVSLQSGANHSVVAYNLEPGPKGNGDYYIDVYDPNRPFNETAQDSCASVEADSRIYVDPSSGWSFKMAGGNTYSGGYGTLEVIPASLVSGGVTFPQPWDLAKIALNGALTVIFGSKDSAGVGSGVTHAELQALATPAVSTGRGVSPLPHSESSLPAALQTGLGKSARSMDLEVADLARRDLEGRLRLLGDVERLAI